MTAPTPEIRLNTVGQIERGDYAGWYVVVVPKSAPGFADSYTVFLCSDSTFAFEPGVRECYDEWVENIPSLEGLFEDKYGQVTWLPDIAPPTMGESPRADSLIERFRARSSGTKGGTTSP
jgi:hypothetical protein